MLGTKQAVVAAVTVRCPPWARVFEADRSQIAKTVAFKGQVETSPIPSRGTGKSPPRDELRIVPGHHHCFLPARPIPTIALVTATRTRSRSSRPFRLWSPARQPDWVT